MALVTEVENHGEFVWRFSNGPDQTPEYYTGHDVSPFGTAPLVERTTPADWLPQGELTFTGTFDVGDNVSVTWIIRNLETGYEENRGADYTFDRPCDPETAALLFGNFVNGNVDTVGAQGGGVCVLAPAQMPAGSEINLGPPVFTPAP